MAMCIEGIGHEWAYIPMNKRILVFEDIDTAGDIVKIREPVVTELSTDEDKKDDKKDKKEKNNKKEKEDKNSLVLGDILNALDGICETTGLVYVLTTNHVETLDPALIRPGRITCSIELKEMNTIELKEMLTYYYVENNIYDESLPNEQKLTFINEISLYLHDKCTPSVIENYCNKYNLVTFYEKMKEIVPEKIEI
jgi:SpoVK/Ycf46/Vps4 family AAA+-type ATPase